MTDETDKNITEQDVDKAEEVINGLVAQLATAIETHDLDKSQKIFNQTAELIGAAPPAVVVPLFLVLLDKAAGLLVDLVAQTEAGPETSDDL